MGKGESTDHAAESEDFSQSFTCPICLDLLYKPIVLSCGHISCFWCVHKSMNMVHKSHCPICRHPYYHFPSICQMLHVLLLKMYPDVYRRREEQTLVEEKEMGLFSPQFDSNACGSHGDQDSNHMKDLEHSSTAVSETSSCSEPCSSGNGEPGGNCKQMAIADVQCAACKQLLFHPIFLNCGHGYCETCISCPDDKTLRCHVCESTHPTGLPKVCLEFDHFLKEQFPREYALRTDAVQLKEAHTKIENPTSCSPRASKKGRLFSSVSNEELSHSKLHIAVGCDSCGMFPIIGERYRCKDCVEAIGFDLCGECYNTRSKLPGRFNQQHTPEHKLERVDSNNIRRVILRMVSEQFEDPAIAFTNHDDPSEIPEIEYQDSPDAEENTRNSLAAVDLHTENPDDQNETQPSS